MSIKVVAEKHNHNIFECNSLFFLLASKIRPLQVGPQMPRPTWQEDDCDTF